MTAYTPIYNLPYVEASDLVASYPTVSEELAENVETAIAGSGGLSLIDEETFSGVSSVSINNVFSADYENYRVLISVTSSTNGAGLYTLRLRASGTDATTSYNGQRLYAQGASTGAGASTNIGYATAGYNDDKPGIFAIEFYGPYATRYTNIRSECSSFSATIMDNYINQHQQNTSYDGFTFSINSLAFTGFLRVYGYKGA